MYVKVDTILGSSLVLFFIAQMFAVERKSYCTWSETQWVKVPLIFPCKLFLLFQSHVCMCLAQDSSCSLLDWSPSLDILFLKQVCSHSISIYCYWIFCHQDGVDWIWKYRCKQLWTRKTTTICTSFAKTLTKESRNWYPGRIAMSTLSAFWFYLFSCWHRYLVHTLWQNWNSRGKIYYSVQS